MLKETFEIILSDEATKFYNKAILSDVKKINKVIDEVSRNPFWGINIKKLRGKFEGSYRYAVGDLRIIYSILENRRIVNVEFIGGRGSAY